MKTQACGYITHICTWVELLTVEERVTSMTDSAFRSVKKHCLTTEDLLCALEIYS